MWEVLKEAGIDPALGRSATTRASFPKSQAEALLACDFFETVTLSVPPDDAPFWRRGRSR